MEVISLGRSGGSGGRSGGGSFGGSRGSGGRIGGSSFGGSRGGSRGSMTGGSRGGTFGGSKNSGLFGGSRTSGFGSGFLLGRALSPSGRYYGGFGSPSRRSGGGGCGCITLIVTIIFIAVFFMIVASIWGSAGSNKSDNITLSTIERKALPSGSVNETKYYTDEIGWINNETKLLSGLKQFYKKTGVQPYLYLTDTINGSHYPSQSELESYANNLYDKLFTDEAHLLLVFFEYDDMYMDWYIAGTQAKSVIDREAADILLDYIDRYYYEGNLSDEEFFSKSFSDAANRIMTVTKSPWIFVFMLAGIIILFIILYMYWKKSVEQKNLEAKRREELLKTPLNKFGSSETEDLMDKYKDKDEQ